MDLHEAVKLVLGFFHANGRPPTRTEFMEMGATDHSIRKLGFNKIIAAAGLITYHKNAVPRENPDLSKPPKILFIDIETAPIEARVWGVWDQNVGLNQITRDWFIMSFAAELDGKMHYLDQRFSSPIEDDSMMLTAVHYLMCEADIIIGHNLAKFDIRKLNARFLKHGMNPPTFYRIIDTLRVAKRHFALTSNKLEYIAKYLGVSEKLTNRKFNGMDLWNQCLAGNIEAWEEMEAYNKNDVVVLREVYEKLIRWDKTINFSMFGAGDECSCGSREFIDGPIKVTNSGKFESKICEKCGKQHFVKTNLVHPDTRKEIMA